MIRALYEAMLDMAPTAPKKALQWEAKHRWIEEHPGWTFDAYENARAGDIQSHDDYLKMRREAEKHAVEKAKAAAGNGE